FAVDEDRACAAHPVFASHVRSGQPDIVSQRITEEPARRYRDVVGHAVDPQADVLGLFAHGFGNKLGHRVSHDFASSTRPPPALSGASASLWAAFNARAVRVRANCARYSAVP